MRQRIKTCKVFHDLRRFLSYLKRLSKGGFSEDESDHRASTSRLGDRQYLRVRPAWRAIELGEWLVIIDRAYLSTRFKDPKRASRGNWVRTRLNSNKVDETCRAVPGLPRNWYDPGWLLKLSPRQILDLDIQPSISFAHTAALHE